MRDWQTFTRQRDQIMYGLKYGPNLGKPLRIEKNKNGNTRSQISAILEDWEESTFLIRMTKNSRKPLNMRGENWKGLWTQPCRAKRRFTRATGNWLRKWLHLTKFQRPPMVVWWSPTKPQGNEWNLLYQQNPKIPLQVMDLLRWPITIWFTCTGCKSSGG